MVDHLSLFVSHAVLLIAFWRLTRRDDLDVDPPVESATQDGEGAGGGRHA